MSQGVKICIAALLALILLLLGLALTVTQWLPRVAGIWLPDKTTIALAANPRWHHGALLFPDLRYLAGDCTLATVRDARLAYRDGRWQLRAAALDIDSGCFSALPGADNPAAPTALAEWQRRLPRSTVHIDRLTISPWQAWSGALSLTLSPVAQRLTWQGETLRASADLRGQQLMLRELRFENDALSQPVTLSGTLTLPHFPDGIPESGALEGHLSVAQVPAPLTLHLRWQQQRGELRVAGAGQPAPLLILPWQLTPRRLTLHDGEWRWPWAAQPLSGGLALTVDDYRDGLSAAVFQGRLNVLTAGRGGKGNVVLTLGPGKLDWQHSALPFRLTGSSKLAQLLFFASLPGTLEGPLLDPRLRMAPGALLRMRGRLLSTLEVDEARWPLAGVTLSPRGVSGRLQAILRAHHPDSGRFVLHLDGRAEDFWPDRGRWSWRYWGKGYLQPLSARWDIAGRGRWQETLIELSTLSTGFDRLRYGLADMATPRLTLSRPLRWQRDAERPLFDGGVVLNARETRFTRGGHLPPSVLRAELNGRSPADFLWRGALQAQAIGPVRVQGRWDGVRLRGQAWWPEQSLRVFQPLISPSLKMSLQAGSLRAQMAFSAASGQGFAAGGHWVVKQGAMRMPDNQISGVDFSLPFRLQDSEWQLGTHGPVQLRIAAIDNQFALHNMTADLQGHYPWRAQQPLTLSNVSVDLLGGQLRLDRLEMPQRAPAMVRLRGLALDKLLAAIKVTQFSLTGRVNGALPLWLNHPEWLVQNGWLANDGPLTLRMDKQVADAIAANNLAAGAALDWLRDMVITRAWATLNLDTVGQMTLRSDVEGSSHFSDKNQRVSLHYHQQENLFQLWRSLRFGDNLQSWVEEHATLPDHKDPRNAHQP
ncbi:YdbH family protein [Pantoea sp. 1.19]|uniref:YdbH family protein n=1 Tax=Pantoea sp. 1.19 TaxID=1925589 RepID=UPI000948E08B|nr:YdbH family protein [Pantoea sp. 1.19]